VRDAHSLPFLATILPTNPIHPKSPPERNEWVAEMNDEIRKMAREEDAILVDLHAAFLREGDLTALLVDHVHPNDRGYAIITEEFFEAITQPRL